MKLNIQHSRIAGLVLLVMIFVGCKKTEITMPSGQAHFANQTGGTYFITAPNTSFSVPVGVTTVADVDRTLTVNITSPTGASQGTQYTVSNNPVVIKAGEALGNIVINGIYNAYTAGRKDTLIMTISSSEVGVSEYNATYKLFMRGPCFEDETDLNDMVGDYNNTNEEYYGGTYGPYTTSISAITSTGLTTGTIKVENIYDYGWNPIVFNLDWTNPLNPTVTLVRQSGIADASTVFGANYAGMSLMVAPPQTATRGSFSYCNKKITLKMILGIAELNAFDPTVYTVVMEQ